MKTIGAKELRLHLDQVLQGEDVIVSHRFKGSVRLTLAVGVPDLKVTLTF